MGGAIDGAYRGSLWMTRKSGSAPLGDGFVVEVGEPE
jgi:hypothetical protein